MFNLPYQTALWCLRHHTTSLQAAQVNYIRIDGTPQI
jgi:hypothetical protein